MTQNTKFWKNKKVFLTGHTGFKGGWLSVFLNHLGAEVLGFSLEAEPQSYFNLVNLEPILSHHVGDIRNLSELVEAERNFKPDILIHMAAQPLVLASYKDPITTFSTNIMGTVNVLELVRMSSSIRSGVIITTDKCYENRNISRGYKEDDPMGGHDPYSSSKGSAELIISSYQRSFFGKDQYRKSSASVASVRAGNVIGGGDWAEDRLIPDLLRSIGIKDNVKVRNPNATRPWQHVLEPLSGYLMVAEQLYKKGPSGSDCWNFGPDKKDIVTVSKVADMFCKAWGDKLSWSRDLRPSYHEEHNLSLDISKAKKTLDWSPKWSLSNAIDKTVEWHKAQMSGKNMLDISVNQIKEFLKE